MVEGKKMRVAVLMGGLSSERNVSLSTGRQVLEGLDHNKYEAFGVDAALMSGSCRSCQPGAGDEVEVVAAACDELTRSGRLVSFDQITSCDSSFRPDVVFVALHGRYGEDGTIQGVLELLGIPYTGSGVLASALAMDKVMAKKVMAADGIPVPASVDIKAHPGAGSWDSNEVNQVVAALGYPVVVKPSRQGSTIGISRVDGPDELGYAISKAAEFDSLIVIERFIRGRELTVSVLGNDDPFALPVIEIVPAKGFYDYRAKYTPGATDEIVPAPIGEDATKYAQNLAIAAHKSLGCRGVSRVDIIQSEEGMFVLEVNTVPGMTPTSLLPRAADAAGISFSKLLDMLIDYALKEGMGR